MSDINVTQDSYDKMRYTEANKNNNLRNELRNTPKQTIAVSSISQNFGRSYEDKHLVKEHNDKMRFNKAFSKHEQHALKHSNY
jgi:hypothetical protein